VSHCPYSKESLSFGSTFVGGNPAELFKQIRDDAPVSYHTDPRSGVNFWAVTGRDELDYVSKNPGLFSSAQRTAIYSEFPEESVAAQRNILLNMDPPGHIKYRRVIKNAFRPRNVEALEPRFREIVRETLESIVQKRECDFVNEISIDLPLIAICEILGVPSSDREQFFKWTNAMLEVDDDADFDEEKAQAREMAAAELFMYADEIMKAHRENPKDDIVGALLSGDVEGECLSDDEFRFFLLLLIVAGNETTRTATNHGMRMLMKYPDQYQALVDDPSLIPNAIEEMLRYNPPVISMRRMATEDVQLGGQAISKGDKVVLFYGAANHDESVFDDPQQFDIRRQERQEVRNAHRTFGVGEHFCLGAHLARIELLVLWEEIVKQIRNPRHNGEMIWLRSNIINGIKSMPIAYDIA